MPTRLGLGISQLTSIEKVGLQLKKAIHGLANGNHETENLFKEHGGS
jgi:hypothetical protein